ncbi:hypothetical protein CPBF427_09980 [Xanthomonas arboricola pv. juglandis]|nr:hypothetical protein CPBF427_09980 [Xanthomonas arboricola pv. juglandis]
MNPARCNWPLTAALMSPIRSFFLSRSRHTQIVLASGTLPLCSNPRKRWKLRRSSTWYSSASSDRLYNCCNSSSRIISSVGHAGRPPLAPVPRRRWPSITAAIATKSMCRDSSSSGSLNCWRLASRSAPANRLIIGSYPGWRWNYDAKDRGFLELPICRCGRRGYCCTLCQVGSVRCPERHAPLAHSVRARCRRPAIFFQPRRVRCGLIAAEVGVPQCAAVEIVPSNLIRLIPA